MNRIYYSLQQKKITVFLLSSQTSPFYSPLQSLMIRVNEINKCFILTTNRQYKKYYLTRSERRRIPER